MQGLRNRVRVSSKGQLVIPKDVRRNMNIKEGDELLLEMVENGVLLTQSRKVKDLMRSHGLRGLLKDEDLDPNECEAILEEAKKSSSRGLDFTSS